MVPIVSALVDEALCKYQQTIGDIDLARFTTTAFAPPLEDNPKLWSQGDVGCLVSQRRFCIIYVCVNVRTDGGMHEWFHSACYVYINWVILPSVLFIVTNVFIH